jgi:Outer membrane protein beta-barrel domain
MVRRAAAFIAAFGLVVVLPLPAAAQALGIGPRFSFVRGDVTSDVPSATFAGGTLRMRSSRHMSIELALDYKSYLAPDASQRIRQLPFQASLLVYPVRGVLSPYLLGGFGVYSEMTDDLTLAGVVTQTTTTRRMGWHFGGGAELFLARHAALFADYRFRFVRLGQSDPGAQAITLPGLSSLHLSHQGSMWTSGMAFYF